MKERRQRTGALYVSRSSGYAANFLHAMRDLIVLRRSKFRLRVDKPDRVDFDADTGTTLCRGAEDSSAPTRERIEHQIAGLRVFANHSVREAGREHGIVRAEPCPSPSGGTIVDVPSHGRATSPASTRLPAARGT